jgi:hypothetical protein
MSEEITNGELHRTLMEVKKQLVDIYTEAKATNGRVRRNEVAIAVLQGGFSLVFFMLGALFVWVVSSWATP